MKIDSVLKPKHMVWVLGALARGPTESAPTRRLRNGQRLTIVQTISLDEVSF